MTRIRYAWKLYGSRRRIGSAAREPYRRWHDWTVAWRFSKGPR